MKKITLFITFVTMAGIFAAAQEIVSARVTNTDNLNEVFASSRYLFPEFQDARVLLKSGSYFVKMNYNALTDEMEYVDENGTLLSLENKKDIQIIILGDRIFKYASKGYLELLSRTHDDVELLVHRTFKGVDRKKIGAFGIASNTVDIASIQLISTDAGLQNLSISEEVTYLKKYYYYLYASGKYLLANKSSFKKVFGKQKPNIDGYLNNNPVDFSKGSDIVRLYIYCTE